MSFLSGIFNKKPKEHDSVISDEIIKYLDGCRYEVIAPAKDTKPLWDRYIAAYEKGKIEGFVPIYIVSDSNVLDVFEINAEAAGGIDKFREKMLSAEIAAKLDSAEEILKKRFDEYRADYSPFDDDYDLYGEFSGGETLNCFSSWSEYSFKKTQELIYVEIPTRSPWEVFAWIPFGDWNECPSPEVIMSVSKLWYEKCCAVPAVITGDCLEFYLPDPVSDKDMALKIAEQQYGFDPDVVDQGTGTLKCLADSITRSNVWFFWWD
ncbi:MAG: DUF4253 domain-containing protein [Clostridium sp.]|nr:DUF4253 domain-containing protein [Clostridium sp.]MCM1548279.1 DUF4253 domain-containing protein [Ruminococcus sp.]